MNVECSHERWCAMSGATHVDVSSSRLCRTVFVGLVFVSLVASCGEDDSADLATTSASDSGVATSAATTTSTGITTTAPTTTSTGITTTASTTTTTVASVAALAIDPSWVPYDDEFVVWGVASDDVLNVRSGPGVANPVITVLDPDERGVRRFDVVVWEGESPWGVIEIPGGAGWVNLSFLRPQNLANCSDWRAVDARTETAADDVQGLLGARDYKNLAGFIDPARGLAISLDAFVGDDDQVLTPDQIANAANDGTVLLWGYTEGEGSPIRATIAQHLHDVAGDPAITSTDVIGFDVRVRSSINIDNIAERFPEAHVVEYTFEGTSLWGEFDWHSVRFVFDTETLAPTGRPALLAIVQDTYAP